MAPSDLSSNRLHCRHRCRSATARMSLRSLQHFRSATWLDADDLSEGSFAGEPGIGRAVIA